MPTKRKSIMILSLLIAIGLFLSVYRNNDRQIHFTDQVAVLEYHHIDSEESEYTISPERFKEHLSALVSHNYHVITIEDFIGFLQGQRKVPPNAVVITFDDGYESYYRYAYPELKRQGMTAANFLIIHEVGNKAAATPFLNWDEIREMNRQGFGFYSHTFNSHDFAEDDKGKAVSPLTSPIYLPDAKRMETKKEYAERVKQDLTAAEKTLREQLGNTLSLLCFPHGRYTRDLVDVANQAGIAYFFTGDYGLNASGDKLVKRITAGVPKLDGDALVDKINKETTLAGRAEDLLKNGLLWYRFNYQ